MEYQGKRKGTSTADGGHLVPLNYENQPARSTKARTFAHDLSEFLKKEYLEVSMNMWAYFFHS